MKFELTRFFGYNVRMARPLRIEYEGALYHITARGNEKKAIFIDERDCERFLGILAELSQRFSTIIHGYVLMGNHYHLLIETPRPNLSRAMHYLNAAYTGYFNRRHSRVGHLLQGRYKALLIEKDRYLLAVSRYIHLNPVRAAAASGPEEYLWSSYSAYIGKGEAGEWLHCDAVLGHYSRNRSQARRLYKRFVEEGLRLPENPFKYIRGGLILGNEEFVEEIKSKISVQRNQDIPQTRDVTVNVSYDSVVAAVSKRLGVSEKDMTTRGARNNLARKICIYLLRSLTDMGNRTIAAQFGIGVSAVSKACLSVKEEMVRNRETKNVVLKAQRELLNPTFKMSVD